MALLSVISGEAVRSRELRWRRGRRHTLRAGFYMSELHCWSDLRFHKAFRKG